MFKVITVILLAMVAQQATAVKIPAALEAAVSLNFILLCLKGCIAQY